MKEEEADTQKKSQVSWIKGSGRKNKSPGPINEGNFTRAVWKEVRF
jgi:hypothetical protein